MLSFFGFLITLAILIVVHEFGHYWMARLFKVKVICFSVGFGPKLLQWQGKHNQWCISLIPLGGYVQMLEETPSNRVNDSLASSVYTYKPAWQRILIAGAGPLANLLFAFIAYYILGMYGVNQLRPVIQSINPTPLVHNLNQLPLNSTIKTINNQAITSWQEAEQIVKQIKLPQTNLIITTTAQQKYTFNLNEYLLNRDHLSLTDLGIYPFRFLSQIAYIEPQSPASQAGLQEQDQIIAINQQSLNSWFNIAQIIRQHPSDKLNFTIKRGQQVLNLPVTIASSTDENGQIIGKIGIMPTLDTHLLAQNSFIQYYTWTSSFIYAYDACLNLIINNLQMIYSLINGQISWHNVGGPVTIAKASGLALHQGIKSFIDLLALISLSLAVMNLLPIPILDGGHIVLYSIEILRGKPLEAKTQHLILTIGLMMVLAITGIALYNDFLKLLNL